MSKIDRQSHSKIEKAMENFPVVAILGPRQSGKTTIAKQLLKNINNSIYLDLELDSDFEKLENAEFYLKENQDKLICIDEIQRKPNLFPLLRALVDQNRVSGRFLILGSASQDLLRQSTETLAGRIAYYELSPFNIRELSIDEQVLHWIRGGFPDSFLAKDDDISFQWRENFIKTFLERDLGNMGFNLSPMQLKKFWTMIAHTHSGMLNKALLSKSLLVTARTVQYWLDIFEQTFMMRVLRPHSNNIKKRLVKSPKVYVRDTGILHTLLQIENFDELMGHPISGLSWEGYAIENILVNMYKWEPSYYRTTNGAEIDLILERKNKIIACEFKISNNPKVERGTYQALEDLGIDLLHVITPKGSGEKVKENIRIDSLETFLKLYK